MIGYRSQTSIVRLTLEILNRMSIVKQTGLWKSTLELATLIDSLKPILEQAIQTGWPIRIPETTSLIDWSIQMLEPRSWIGLLKPTLELATLIGLLRSILEPMNSIHLPKRTLGPVILTDSRKLTLEPANRIGWQIRILVLTSLID